MSAQKVWVLAAVTAAALGVPVPAAAQTDEIQVYTGSLADPHVFNLTLHNNVIASGSTTPAFPGAVTADKSWNGVPEWAYGVTRWFEAGLYLPLYSRDHDTGWGLNGFKLRTLFAVPNADDRTFVYGSNFEFSYNAKRWDTSRFTSEIRPIVGWHLGQWDLFINPILDTAYDGVKNLDFAPSLRLAYNFSENWAVAAEHYADFGPVKKFLPGSEQSHQLFAVMDYSGEPFDIEAGVGFGLTNASDHLTLKLILSRDLN
jgi:opacity protein-like surface antigen